MQVDATVATVDTKNGHALPSNVTRTTLVTPCGAVRWGHLHLVGPMVVRCTDDLFARKR